MEIPDQLNAKDGRGTLYFAGQGIQPQWQMKRDMLSPRYTTRFSDLLVVRRHRSEGSWGHIGGMGRFGDTFGDTRKSRYVH